MSSEVLKQLAGISTATVTMQLLKRGLRNCFIVGARPLNPRHSHFVASAYTLPFIPMREDLSRVEVLGDPEYPARKAIEDIPPGMALVIDGRGEPGAGVIGDILTARLQERGVAAVVSDGPVRDGVAVAARALPIFCPGFAAPASLHVHFGADLQSPIACGGVAVIPGDILVGDNDGVVVIPAAMAQDIARDGAEQERLEGFLKCRVEAGHPTIGTYPPNEETLQGYDDWKRNLDDELS
ncbi:MAG: ribonuclease activity regulator RraA [Alphaproteobacteria bacterium]